MLLRKFVWSSSPSESRCLVLSTLSLFIDVGEMMMGHRMREWPLEWREYIFLFYILYVTRKQIDWKFSQSQRENGIEITYNSMQGMFVRWSSYFIILFYFRLFFSLRFALNFLNPVHLACGDRNQIRCRCTKWVNAKCVWTQANCENKMIQTILTGLREPNVRV